MRVAERVRAPETVCERVQGGVTVCDGGVGVAVCLRVSHHVREGICVYVCLCVCVMVPERVRGCRTLSLGVTWCLRA